jgi:hypothetical protein
MSIKYKTSEYYIFYGSETLINSPELLEKNNVFYIINIFNETTNTNCINNNNFTINTLNGSIVVNSKLDIGIYILSIIRSDNIHYIIFTEFVLYYIR